MSVWALNTLNINYSKRAFWACRAMTTSPVGLFAHNLAYATQIVALWLAPLIKRSSHIQLFCPIGWPFIFAFRIWGFQLTFISLPFSSIKRNLRSNWVDLIEMYLWIQLLPLSFVRRKGVSFAAGAEGFIEFVAPPFFFCEKKMGFRLIEKFRFGHTWYPKGITTMPTRDVLVRYFSISRHHI